jgi:hypothetical protein
MNKNLNENDVKILSKDYEKNQNINYFCTY